MSRIIIEDTGRVWEIYYDGQLKWMGTVNGLADLELVGPVDYVEANNASIYTGSETTGLHYSSVTDTVTPFNAFDSYEAFRAAFHFAAYAILLFLILGAIHRILINRNPTP